MVSVVCQYAFLELFSRFDLNQRSNDEQFFEKYLFVKKLLTKNLALNKDEASVNALNQAKLQITAPGQNRTAGTTEFFLSSTRKNTQNRIKSDEGVVARMMSFDTSIDKSLLPHYLLVVADNQVCDRIMNTYGIVCVGISDGRILVDPDYYEIKLEATKNLFEKFCSVLSNLRAHQVNVIDPHFFSKQGIDYAKINTSISSSRSYILGIHFSDNPKNLQHHHQSKTKDMVQAEIAQKCKALLSKVNLCSHTINKYDFHDRYLISNIKFYISGNSFCNTCETHLTSYPIGLYFENLPERIRQLL